MKLFKLVLILILFSSCTDAQVTKMILKNKTSTTPSDEEFPALSGETSFTMTDIAGESIPDLYISYNIPAGPNKVLLVYVHGWNGGGGIVGGIDPDAISYLHSEGIGIIGVGMRGRNTGVDYANDPAEVVKYRDAGALENYDVYKSIKYFIEDFAPVGQIDKSKIVLWVISGGGGAGAGCAAKFPGLISTDVLWYAISKYGTYDSDTRPSLTSWYTDDVNFEGQIQGAVGGAPKGEAGYSAGIIDEYYIARDHINGISNSADTKFHLYHDSNDFTVFDDLSDAVAAKLLADGVDYEYHHTTNGDYNHGEADLLLNKFSLSPQHGLHWIDDATTITRTEIPNSGTMYVNGYVIPVDNDLEPIFSYWIKSFRKNAPADPASQARRNQGKTGAATLTYNLTNNTFETQLIKGNSSVGDQFYFVEVSHGADNITALLATNDVVTLEPTTWNLKPLSLDYDWNVYHDFSNADYYLLDDLTKVSNAFDLTGNNNFSFQPTRASRASIVSGSLDNGVVQYNGTSSTLATNVDFIQYPGEFTFIIKIDPDDASVADVSENLFGRGAGSSSLFQMGNFSGKITCTLDTETGTALQSTSLPGFGPANTNLGLQTWVIKRDASNDVYITMKGSTTVNYNTGTGSKFGNISGTFDLRVLGSGAALTKQFAGKIYKFAAASEAISDADVTAILDNW